MNLATVPHSIVALVLYALWVIALVLMVGADRVLQVMRGETAITSFTPGMQHGTDSYWRINRAHMNAAENLAVFAAIVLAGWVAGEESATFNLLAEIVIVARVIQSVIHIWSGSPTAINLRFTAFAVQLISEIWMALLVLHTANLF